MSCKKKKCCPKCDCKFDRHDRPKCDCEKPKHKDECKPDCCVCKDGRDGRDGMQGKQGPKGDKGDKGEPGVSPEACIANAYNTTAQTIANNTPILFDTQGVEDGINRPSNSEFEIVNSGIYSFNYSINVAAALNGEFTAIFGLLLERGMSISIIPGTSFSVDVGPLPPAGSGNGSINGAGAIELEAGDRIRLFNVSGANVALNISQGEEAEFVNAELTLECVDVVI